MVFIIFGSLASHQKLLLVDANIREQQLHEAVDQSSELLMDLFMLAGDLLLYSKEKDAVGLDK